ncbi:HoxN/HupN/NixA family nickel/cobalt transporter [Streptomyces sp. NBC_00467]|uniref:HoxN/HupN/NixA family nickel/cobalt transporter n=1 Tax=Streptomyces sp. NBC_00467 TaxID=2975752 RepID=UPI002E18977C
MSTVSRARTLRKRIAVVGTLVAGLFLVFAGTAAAHPLGNFTVNRYDGLVVARGELRVDHVEDLAEIPTAQIDPGVRTPAKLPAWAAARCATAAREARAEVNGHAVALRAGASRADLRPGQAGLATLRLECELTAALPDGEAAVSFRAPGGDGGPGWREVTARGDRMTLAESDVPRESLSRRLSEYPEDRLASPPDRTKAALEVVPGGPALASDGDEEGAGPASVLPRGADRWTQALTGLVERRDLTLPFAALALATAIALGAMHALAPGHGKTLMAAAAAAGGRNSVREVLTLGISVTVTHTLGVFALGALVAAGSAAAPSVVAWLGVASGALVALAGAALVLRAWRRRGRPHHHHHHGHGHDHGHAHGHDHHGDGHSHGHAHHGHGHSHDHHGHPHSLPGEKRRGLRGTLLLGFAGGMVPSPSAVVVLVGAAALGHAWFGFLLVLAYGAGLALTLAAAGFLVVRVGAGAAKRLAERKRHGGRVLALAHRAAPLGTAFVVFVLGCGLVFRGAAAAWS